MAMTSFWFGKVVCVRAIPRWESCSSTSVKSEDMRNSSLRMISWTSRLSRVVMVRRRRMTWPIGVCW